MRTRLWVAGALATGLVAGFAAGFAAGNRWTFGWLMPMFETQAVGNLNLRVRQAELIRSGEIDRAVELMESQVDAALASLSSGRSWEKLSPPVRRALQKGKRYRQLHPPSGGLSPAARAALDAIPDAPLEPEACPRPGSREQEAREPGPKAP